MELGSVKSQMLNEYNWKSLFATLCCTTRAGTPSRDDAGTQGIEQGRGSDLWQHALTLCVCICICTYFWDGTQIDFSHTHRTATSTSTSSCCLFLICNCLRFVKQTNTTNRTHTCMHRRVPTLCVRVCMCVCLCDRTGRRARNSKKKWKANRWHTLNLICANKRHTHKYTHGHTEKLDTHIHTKNL